MGDLFMTISMLGTFIVPLIVAAIIIFFLYKFIKKKEIKWENQIKLEKETSLHLQKKIDTLEERLKAVEKVLNDI